MTLSLVFRMPLQPDIRALAVFPIVQAIKSSLFFYIAYLLTENKSCYFVPKIQLPIVQIVMGKTY